MKRFYNADEMRAKVESSLLAVKAVLAMVEAILAKEYFKELDGKVINVKATREFQRMKEEVIRFFGGRLSTSSPNDNWWVTVDNVSVEYISHYGHKAKTVGDNEHFILGGKSHFMSHRFDYASYRESMESVRQTYADKVQVFEQYLKDWQAIENDVEVAFEILKRVKNNTPYVVYKELIDKINNYL